MAAAPVAATVGGLLLPQGAEAAEAAGPMPLDLRMRTRANGSGTSYPDVIKRLLLIADSARPEERLGLGRASLDDIVADTDREGRPARPDWPGASLPRLRTSFQWQGAGERNSIANDFKTRYWVPRAPLQVRPAAEPRLRPCGAEPGRGAAALLTSGGGRHHRSALPRGE
ncbi:hypothetical protein GCM10010271_35520 [Streptomyces kurssanovii]|nr:hypothetical protein GCM10010271_35520 [Streptomyces kurssanovii]